MVKPIGDETEPRTLLGYVGSVDRRGNAMNRSGSFFFELAVGGNIGEEITEARFRFVSAHVQKSEQRLNRPAASGTQVEKFVLPKALHRTLQFVNESLIG